MLSASELPRAESEVATPSALLAALPMPRSSSEIVSPSAEFLPPVQLSDFGADKRRSGQAPAPAPASRASQAEPAAPASAPLPGSPSRVQPAASLAEQSMPCHQAPTVQMPARTAVTGCHVQQGVGTHCMLASMQRQPITADTTSNSVSPIKDDMAKTATAVPALLNSRPALQRNALLAANATAATTQQNILGCSSCSMSSYRPNARDPPRFSTVPPVVQQKQGMSIASLQAPSQAPSQVLSLGQAITASSHSARVMGNSSDVVGVSRLPSAASAPRLQTVVGSPRPAERMLHTSFRGHPTSGCHRSPATSKSCSYSVPQPCTGTHLRAPSPPPCSPQPRAMMQRSADSMSICPMPGNHSIRAASSPSSAIPAAASRTNCRAPPMASRVEPSLSPPRLLQGQVLQQAGSAMPWCQSCTRAPAVSHGAHTCASSQHRPGPSIAAACQAPRPITPATAGLPTGPMGPAIRCVAPSASAVGQVPPTFATMDRSLRQPALHAATCVAGGRGSPAHTQHYFNRTRT